MIDEPGLVAFQSGVDNIEIYAEEVGATIVRRQISVGEFLSQIGD